MAKQLIYRGDDMSLYGKTFDIVEEFKYSYYVDMNGIKYRVSMNDVELKEEDNDRTNTMGNQS